MASEIQLLRERFGDDLEVVFDGDSEQCPLCHHASAQLSLWLGFVDYEPAACEHCGAVFAA